MTMGPAYASFMEDTIGSLASGKKADFIILNRDIMSIAENKVLECRVSEVIIDGLLAFRN